MVCKKKIKGSAFGYPFLFFSAIFFGFLGFVLSQGGSDWLVASSTTSFNYTNTTDYQNVGWDIINPFSTIGFLAWLSIAIALVDGYIIVSSIT